MQKVTSMHLVFSKYQGTGNDFIMLDNLDGKYNDLSIEQVKFLCDRRFGIGADGLIKLNAVQNFAFEVDYYNSDGSKSFCGNGARCSVAFAETLGIDVAKLQFWAIDGKHKAEKKDDLVYLEMQAVKHIELHEKNAILDTGSPHFVSCVEDLSTINIVELGKLIRYSDTFKKEGINVNAMEIEGMNAIRLLTYERGVEDETLSCGTGATAAALVYGAIENLIGSHTVDVHVKGGDLKVAFTRNEVGAFDRIQLIGPAVFVFNGEIEC